MNWKFGYGNWVNQSLNAHKTEKKGEKLQNQGVTNGVRGWHGRTNVLMMMIMANWKVIKYNLTRNCGE